MSEIKVVVVEDNDADLFLIRQACKENGLHVSIASFTDGDTARDYLLSLADCTGLASCPQLIVLDLNLPGTNGHDLLQLIRSTHACSTIPVAILTSSAAHKDRVKALKLGANKFLVKPADLDEFLSLGKVFRELIYGNTPPVAS